MKIICIGTGSKGNSYLVEFEEGTKIILDCGVSSSKIQRKVNLNDVALCYVSHTHRDHCSEMEKLASRGVKIVKGYEYPRQAKLSLKRANKYDITLYLFPIAHGNTDNALAIIECGNERLMYATDFSFCEYNLKSFMLTDIIVECNYVEKYIQEKIKNLEEREIPTFKYKRQINTHMGLNGLEIFLKGLDLLEVDTIHLVHISEDVEDISLMKCEMANLIMSQFKKNCLIGVRLGGWQEFYLNGGK